MEGSLPVSSEPDSYGDLIMASELHNEVNKLSDRTQLSLGVKYWLIFVFSAQSSATLVESLRDLIENSEIGPLLGELRHHPFSALAYLMDFVHMVYKPSSDIEYQVYVQYYFTKQQICFLNTFFQFSLSSFSETPPLGDRIPNCCKSVSFEHFSFVLSACLRNHSFVSEGTGYSGR